MFALLNVRERPFVLGHRGAPMTAPENTIPSFEAAASQGADGFELDVHRSSDGAIVVAHDPTLDRTTDSTGPIAARTAAELAGVDAGWAFAGPAGGHPFRGQGIGIPLLDTALDFAAGRGLLVNVEIKSDGDDAGLGAEVAGLVSRRREADRVFLSSFSIDVARAAVVAAPEVGVALLTIGWAPLEALAAAVEAGCRGLHPDLVSLTEAGARAVVTAAREAGCWLAPWTVNDPAAVARVADAGVSAVITDEPGKAAAALAERSAG